MINNQEIEKNKLSVLSLIIVEKPVFCFINRPKDFAGNLGGGELGIDFIRSRQSKLQVPGCNDGCFCAWSLHISRYNRSCIGLYLLVWYVTQLRRRQVPESRFMVPWIDVVYYKVGKIIQFEFGECDIFSRVFLRDFYDVLADYHIYRLDSDRLIPLFEYEAANEIFRYQNFIAVRKNFPSFEGWHYWPCQR